MSPKELRRQQILDAARDVFARKGYHTAKIEDVVTAAGVARGTFYLYFQDKRSIFEELLARFFHRVALAVSRIDPGLPVEPQVRTNLRAVVDLCLSDPAMTKILITDASGLDEDFDRRLAAFYADIESLLVRSLTEGQSLGLVQPGDTRVMGHFLLGGMKEVVLQLVRTPNAVDRAQVIQDVYALLARGVLMGSKVRAVDTGRPALL